MLSLDIPGFGLLRLEHLVLDFNGTIALDGKLIPRVSQRFSKLSRYLKLHVLTADTFGTVQDELRGKPCQIVMLSEREQASAKAAYVRRMGAARTASIGNGRNDELMMRAATLSIAVIQAEGAAATTIRAADLVVTDIRNALDLLLNSRRLLAGLRR